MAPKRKATPSKSQPHLKPGSLVEISSDEPGFDGAWYEGTVVRRASAKNATKLLVEYTHLFADEVGKKPLREITDVAKLRPVPPRERDRDFKFNEEVDACHNDGWWEGEISEALGDGRYIVFFRPTREQIEFRKEDIRLHREWVNGAWEPPLEQQEEKEKDEKEAKEEEEASPKAERISKKAKVKSSKAMTEKFSKGTLVEVSSDEDGFQGCWFAATIVEARGKGKYLVEYQSLRTEDDTEFLREEIDTLHIRPYPPETVMVDRFNKLEEVDALYNDGWWVGVISKVLTNSRYLVYFKGTNEEMEFEHSLLRLHKDWIDGKWVSASRDLKL